MSVEIVRTFTPVLNDLSVPALTLNLCSDEAASVLCSAAAGPLNAELSRICSVLGIVRVGSAATVSRAILSLARRLGEWLS